MARGMTRNFLDISGIDADTLRNIIDHSRLMKVERRTGDSRRTLSGKTLAMVFERPSTRTRVSFDVAMRDMGGQTIVLSGGEMQLGRGETIADTAQVLSRYVDAIMIRALDHEMVVDLAANASVPVINGLTKWSHPCQVVADIMTFEEHRETISGKRIAWLGDGNNVMVSWVHAAAHFGFSLAVATPGELAPSQALLDWARDNGADVSTTSEARVAAEGADCIVTDTWVSMGDEDGDRRRALLAPYQVDAGLMAHAKSEAVFMHCLPAHRGEEVTAEVIDGPQSIVFDEAENRLHAQKGILAWCFDTLPE